MRILSLLLFLSLKAQADDSFLKQTFHGVKGSSVHLQPVSIKNLVLPQDSLEAFILNKLEGSEAFEYFKRKGVGISVKLVPDADTLGGFQKFFRSSDAGLSRVEIRLNQNIIGQISKELDILGTPKNPERIAAILIPRALAELEAAKISEDSAMPEEKMKACEAAALKNFFQQLQDSSFLMPAEAKYLEDRFGSVNALLRGWRLTLELERKWQRLAAPALGINDAANFIVETRDSQPREQWDLTMRIWKQQTENLAEKSSEWDLDASAVKKLTADRVTRLITDEIHGKIPSHTDYHNSNEFRDRYKPLLKINEATGGDASAQINAIGKKGVEHWIEMSRNGDPNQVHHYLRSAIEWSKYIQESQKDLTKEKIFKAIRESMVPSAQKTSDPSAAYASLNWASEWGLQFTPSGEFTDELIEAYLSLAARTARIDPDNSVVNSSVEEAQKLAFKRKKDISGRMPDLERYKIEGWLEQAKNTRDTSDTQYTLNKAEKKANANRLEKEFAAQFALAQAELAARYGEIGFEEAVKFCFARAQDWAKQAGIDLEKQHKDIARRTSLGLTKSAQGILDFQLPPHTAQTELQKAEQWIKLSENKTELAEETAKMHLTIAAFPKHPAEEPEHFFIRVHDSFKEADRLAKEYGIDIAKSKKEAQVKIMESRFHSTSSVIKSVSAAAFLNPHDEKYVLEKLENSEGWMKSFEMEKDFSNKLVQGYLDYAQGATFREAPAKAVPHFKKAEELADKYKIDISASLRQAKLAAVEHSLKRAEEFLSRYKRSLYRPTEDEMKNVTRQAEEAASLFGVLDEKSVKERLQALQQTLKK